MPNIKSLVRNIGNYLSFPETQKIFSLFYAFALAGMNYSGCTTKDSGEENALNFLKFSPGENLTFFDVGANQGDYALLLNKKFPGVKIFSFEPSKKTFSLLQNNVKNLPNIACKNFGFGQENMEATLYSEADGSGLASVYQRQLAHFGITMDKTETIQIKTIDSFCAESGIKKINLLKIDIEGNELNALRGAKKMIDAGAIDYIQFEFGGCNIDSKVFFMDIFYFLKDKYRIYRILRNGVYEIKSYQQRWEIFAIANFICERIK